ncbi:MAG: hypothetical protein LBH96_03915 [Candidatus Peribacteria bacterium]|nr:hypothetical protein [Candidatus Peribacteria bacterium]
MVAPQRTLPIITLNLDAGETKISFINQSSLSQMISIPDIKELIIVVIAIIPQERNAR